MTAADKELSNNLSSIFNDLYNAVLHNHRIDEEIRTEQLKNEISKYINPPKFKKENMIYSEFEKILINKLETKFHEMIPNSNSVENKFILNYYIWIFLYAQFNSIFYAEVSLEFLLDYQPKFEKESVREELNLLKTKLNFQEEIKLKHIDLFDDFIVSFLNQHNLEIQKEKEGKLLVPVEVAHDGVKYYSINSFCYMKYIFEELSLSVLSHEHTEHSFDILIAKTI